MNHKLYNDILTDMITSVDIRRGKTAVIETIDSSRITTPNGSLDERLARIEAMLHIPTRNIEMENNHPKLKKLWEEYNEELSKLQTWNNIKNSK
jgi:hypothetical protein